MPQNIPEFTFGEDALRVRQFLYEYWCEHGHGPNLRAVHEATGLARERIIDAYKQLELGGTLVLDPLTQNGNVLKIQPFSTYASQVEVHIGGKFHSFAGCAMESVAISKMPPFAGKELRIESYCACCLEPVTITTRDGEILTRKPESVRIHVSLSPHEWNTVNIVAMCDGMNFVHDADHAAAYEKKVARRGVLFTLEQAQRFVADTGNNRMHRYDWPPVSVRPEKILNGIKALGVDVSNWGG
jgi:hypothetical protein